MLICTISLFGYFGLVPGTWNGTKGTWNGGLMPGIMPGVIFGTIPGITMPGTGLRPGTTTPGTGLRPGTRNGTAGTIAGTRDGTTAGTIPGTGLTRNPGTTSPGTVFRGTTGLVPLAVGLDFLVAIINSFFSRCARWFYWWRQQA